MEPLVKKITVELLLKYKDSNREMHPNLVKFASNLNYKNKPPKFKSNHWRKLDTKIKNNWVMNNKFDKTDDDKLYSQIRSILNKLSDSNFNQLVGEFIQLDIKNRDHLLNLVDIIFKKAIVESKFNAIYAKLCFELASYYIEEDSRKIYFRELLLNKCQKMFEEGVSLDKSMKEEAESIFKFKNHVLGCMRFVGELYNHNLITNKIIYSCFLILLAKVNLNKAHCIDCICTLMSTVGKQFVTSYEEQADNYFLKLNKIMNSGKIEAKERFALMDLFDLKKQW